MPTNEQRRATAKRKLERQLERRAQASPKAPDLRDRRCRRSWPGGRRRGSDHRHRHQKRAQEQYRGDDHARQQLRGDHDARSADAAGRRCRRSSRRPTWAPTASTRRRRTRPASRSTRPATGKVPTDPAQVSASMATNQGNIGLHAGQQRITVHGQQFRQPGRAELLQRHHMPPADHLAGRWRSCNAATRRARAPAGRATSSTTSTRPTSTRPTTPS